MALFQTLQDSFDGPSISASLWTVVDSNIVSNQLNLNAPNLSTTYATVTSVNNYDLTGSYALVQLINAGNQNTSDELFIVQLIKDSNNKLIWYLQNSSIRARTIIANSTVDHNATTYSSMTHQWLKIRESAGTTYWDYSSNGVTWTNLYNVANPFAITSLSQEFALGQFPAVVGADTAILDNFNIFPNTFKTLTGVGN